MKILIVGAGAVGQVYGWQLHQAGHEVVFFIKEKYQAELEKGLLFFQHKGRKKNRHEWNDVQTLSSVSDVQTESWDLVILTISTDALRSPSTIPLLSSFNDATVLSLQSNLDDGFYIEKQLKNPAQMVQGLIAFMSYQSPLPGDQGESGVAFLLPLGSKNFYGGADANRVKQLVKMFKQAKLPSAQVKDFRKDTSHLSAFSQAIVSSIELNDWNLSTLSKSQHFQLGIDAAREALSAVSAETGKTVWHVKALMRPLVVKVAMVVIPKFIPFPLDRFLANHYGRKILVQNLIILNSYIEIGDKHGTPTTALKTLVPLLQKKQGLI